jgi:hypothetical protein
MRYVWACVCVFLAASLFTHITDDHNIVIRGVCIQRHSIVFEIVVSRYCLMISLRAETYFKIQLINSFFTGKCTEILIIVVL